MRFRYKGRLRDLAAAGPLTVQRHAYGAGEEQYGELRLPLTAGPHPVAVLIHGGYWRAMWRADLMNALAVDLTQRGFATWNLEYRRVGNSGGGWPGTFDDVGAGFDHLLDLDQRASLDLARVGVVGHSAGGQLALWLGSRPGQRPGMPGAEPRLVPAGIVALAGVCDLVEAARLRLSEGAVIELLGGLPDDVPDRYAAASPVQLVPLRVPQLLVHGDRDDLVPLAMSRTQSRLATAAGDRAELLAIAGADHFDVMDPRTSAWAQAAQHLGGMLV